MMALLVPEEGSTSLPGLETGTRKLYPGQTTTVPLQLRNLGLVDATTVRASIVVPPSAARQETFSDPKVKVKMDAKIESLGIQRVDGTRERRGPIE